jgi:glycosyltransferase involved in cell wall biosynthesis
VQAEPLVSVVMPVLEGERFLPAALESVAEQSYEALEIVVVDDGSTDRSGAIARELGARVIRQDRAGVAAARNAGIAAARGELIAFLDADDLWASHKLSIQVDCLESHPETGYVLSQMQLFLEPNTARPPWFKEDWLREPQQGFLTTMLARRHVFDTVGGFDVSFQVGSDTDWLARAKDSGIEYRTLPDVLARYRIHHAGVSYGDRGGTARGLLRALRASVERQRSAAASGGANES